MLMVHNVTLCFRHVGWKSLVILYETEEGLVRLQEVLRLQNTFRADAIKVTNTDCCDNLLKKLLPGYIETADGRKP